MSDFKERTWPASVCRDPQDERLWNVRALDGFVVFSPGVSKAIAEQARDGMNEHYDFGAAA